MSSCLLTALQKYYLSSSDTFFIGMFSDKMDALWVSRTFWICEVSGDKTVMSTVPFHDLMSKLSWSYSPFRFPSLGLHQYFKIDFFSSPWTERSPEFISNFNESIYFAYLSPRFSLYDPWSYKIVHVLAYSFYQIHCEMIQLHAMIFALGSKPHISNVG